MSENSIRVVGIDPGAVTGIVCITLPSQSRDLRRAGWVGSVSVIRRSPRVKETIAEAQARFFHDLYEALQSFEPELAVIEEPSDSMRGGWNKTEGRGQGRGTGFGLGAAYGMAISALGCCQLCDRIDSYLVSGSKTRAGWMPKVKTGHLTHTMKHSQLAELLCGEAIELSGDRSFAERNRFGEFVRDDELMAFGVLRHHITQCGANV